ncbi:MAG: isopentenyl phosphate kinase [Anaerolineae bacterium]
MYQPTSTIFLKLGGSLITDKTRAYTARREAIARLACEVRQALDVAPDLRLLIGHGSGSFGHWAARPYGTRQGVHTPSQWRGYAEVAAAAARLNRIVTDAFLEAGVPVLSVQPSASVRCHDYALEYLDMRPIHAALARGLVPLVYGDVALDDVHGGTIVSTEDLFLYLAHELRPARILLLGEVDGVLDSDGGVIPRITPADLPTMREVLGGSEGVDVTGGMADKVARMVGLVQRHPETRVHVLTGVEPGLLTQALLDTDPHVGTWITAQ